MKLTRFSLASLIGLLTCAALTAQTALAQQAIYFLGQPSALSAASTPFIGRANLRATIRDTLKGPLVSTTRIALEQSSRQIFYNAAGSLYTTDFSGKATLLPPIKGGATLYGIVANGPDNRLLVLDASISQFRLDVLDLDGTELDNPVSFTSALSDIGCAGPSFTATPRSVVYSASQDTAYFSASSNDRCGFLFAANIPVSGYSVCPLISGNPNISAGVVPRGLALDDGTHTLYMCSGSSILKADVSPSFSSLCGSGIPNPTTVLSSITSIPGISVNDRCEDLAIDTVHHKLYISVGQANGTTLIGTINLDGSAPTALIETGGSDDLGYVYDIQVSPRTRTVLFDSKRKFEASSTPIDFPPFVSVNSAKHRVTITMENFSGGDVSSSGATSAAQLSTPIASPAGSSRKVRIRYLTRTSKVNNSGHEIGKVIRSESQRNQVTLRHVASGNYKTKYRVRFLRKQKNGRYKSIGTTKYSPSSSFTV